MSLDGGLGLRVLGEEGRCEEARLGMENGTEEAWLGMENGIEVARCIEA